MKAAKNVVKGMKHVIGRDALKYQAIVDQCRDVLEKNYGFSPTFPSIVEQEKVFAKTLGVQSDIVLKEMYRLERKGLVLRPEGTAGLLNSFLGEVDLHK